MKETLTGRVVSVAERVIDPVWDDLRDDFEGLEAFSVGIQLDESDSLKGMALYLKFRWADAVLPGLGDSVSVTIETGAK